MNIFEKVRWQNLLSTGNQFTEIVLNKNRTTLIVGTNGAGKSTVLDAIIFVLFGKPFRKITKPQMLNTITNKNLLVELEMTSNGHKWLIRRGAKPNLFEIHKDGKLVPQDAANGDYQGYLERYVIGMNQKAFTQVDILGSANFVPFMQLDAKVRREVIEDLLDIQVFSVMNAMLKDRVKNTKESLQSIRHKIELVETRIESNQEHLKSVQASNDELIAKKRSILETYEAEAKTKTTKIKKLKSQIEEMESFITDSPDVINQKYAYESDIRDIQKEITTSEKMVTFLHDSDTCPTCKQGIDGAFKKSHEANHELLVDTKQGEIKRIEDLIKPLETRIEEILRIKRDITPKQKEHDTLSSDIRTVMRMAQNLAEEIEELEQPLPIYNDQTESLNNELSILQAQLAVASKQSDLVNAAAVLLKDGGIKSVIIKQYVPIINQLINQALTAMDFFVDFQINENFEEVIKSRYRDEFSYESFSEGEKMRIDLAILFTWRAIAKMRNSAASNLLLFDEVLDSSLDQTGIDEFINILKTLSEHENIFVISHRGDAIGDKFDDVIRFNKVKNFSQIVET